MKKFLSLFLSVVMLLSITAGLDFSASAANTIATLYWPVHDKSSGAALKTVTTKFNSVHHGIDISAGVGQKWYAAYDGTIYKVYTGCKTNANGNHKKSCSPNTNSYYKNCCNNGFGNGVVIKCIINGTIYYMQYAHMNSVSGNLKVGAKITKGTYLGTVGDRGYSYGAHAHFEVNKSELFKNYCNNDPTSSNCIFKYDYTVVNSQATNVKISFNANGGSASSGSLTISKGSKMGAKIPTATRYGYVFEGWYTASTGGTKYTNDTKINSNITLYAHWSKINDYTGGLRNHGIYRIISKKSGMALQSNGAGDGALVRQQPKSDTNKQLWKVGFGGGVMFTNANGGRLLDVKGGNGNMANEAQLQLYGFDNGSNENRTFIPVNRGNGYYSIHALHSNRVVDIAYGSTSAGAQCQQYYYTGVDQQLFRFEEVTARNVTFYDNLSNNYLPTPREVYNYSGGTNPRGCYISRNTDYVTTSVNAPQNKLIINAKKAGSSGNDMTFATTVNGSYNYDLYDKNTNTMYLCFTAKSSVNGAKMYFRWGYDSAYKSVTLNTTAANYIIELPRTLNSGSNLHPYIDRVCTVEMTNIQLKSNSTSSVDLSKGDTFNYQTKNYNINNNNGTYGYLPLPIAEKNGCVFDGWYTDRIGGTKVNEYSKINYNTKLYAHWKKAPEASHTHSYDSGKVTKNATCTTTGVKTYTCISCGATKISVIDKTEHTYKSTITKATLSSNGIIENKCTECGEVSDTAVINSVKTIKLSTNNLAYNGKAQKPSVIVKDSAGKALKLNTDYAVTYSDVNSKNVNKYIVTINFKGNYSGSKTIGYCINPKGTDFLASNKGGIKAVKNGFALKWNKQSSFVTGYKIQYATKSDFSNAAYVNVFGANNISKTITGRAGSKKYYVRIQTFYKIDGKTFYSPWSSGKAVTTLK